MKNGTSLCRASLEDLAMFRAFTGGVVLHPCDAVPPKGVPANFAEH